MSDETPSVERVDNDELTAFVSSTLAAIFAGISSAESSARKGAISGHATFAMPDKVEFDIAVTARHLTEGSKGLKLEVFRVGGNLGSADTAEQMTVSRVRFEVPWRFTNTTPRARLEELGKSLA